MGRLVKIIILSA